MLRKAYEVPKAILIHADKQPKASLFLLGALESHTEDWSLKQRISEIGLDLQAAASNPGPVAP
jgi:hypothetical protein